LKLTMDRPDSEMAEWHAPWENSRDVVDGEVAYRLFGALHSLGGRQLGGHRIFEFRLKRKPLVPAWLSAHRRRFAMQQQFTNWRAPEAVTA